MACGREKFMEGGRPVRRRRGLTYKLQTNSYCVADFYRVML
jgi:hypothetical protein